MNKSTNWVFLLVFAIGLTFAGCESNTAGNEEGDATENTEDSADNSANEDSDDLADLETEIVIKRLQQDVNLSDQQVALIREHAKVVQKEVDKLDLVHQSELKQERKKLRKKTKQYILDNILTPEQADTVRAAEAQRQQVKQGQ